jgi:hypothetical protein
LLLQLDDCFGGALGGFAAENAAVQFGDTLGFVCCEALFGCRDRWAGVDGSAEWGDDGGYDMVDGSADFQAVEADYIALVEGIVGIVDKVVGVVCEVLSDAMLVSHVLRHCYAKRAAH